MIGGMLAVGPQPPMLQHLSPTTRNARAAQLQASRLTTRVEQLEKEGAQRSAERIAADITVDKGEGSDGGDESGSGNSSSCSSS